jgi:hypothetical protein
MVLSVYKSTVLLIFGLIFTGSLHAEPVLVLGSFSDQKNATSHIQRVENRLGKPAYVAQTLVNTKPYYRVVISTQGASIKSLKRHAADAGFSGAWSWNAPLSRDQSLTTQAMAAAPRRLVNPLAKDQFADRVKVITNTDAKTDSKVVTEVIDLDSDGTNVDILIPQIDNLAEPMVMDGRLDEAIWSEIPGYDNMLVIDPDTLADTRYKTDVRMFYTDKGLHFAAFMEQPHETHVARLSSRDEFINRDAIGITLDTSGEGLYGYWFSVNLGGSVMDGKVAAERQFSREWDGPWTSATAVVENGWSAEMFLPWSMMTMAASKSGERKLGFWINRKVAYIDERWSWPALPFASKRFMSALANMRTPNVEPKQQIAAFPYASHTIDDASGEDESRVGVDLSWRPSSDVQITAALNPDFGAVESDDVVVNLTAFETFFPEKRLFFLEGQEVFATTPRSQNRGSGPTGRGSRGTASTFSSEPTTLLNTRRIGGAARIDVPANIDVAGVELGSPTNLLGAAKVTGQSGGWRYGVLGASEDEVSLRGTINTGVNQGQEINVTADGRDFGVVRLLYEDVGEGRRSIGYLGTVVSYPDTEAVVHGVDSHWLSKNGAWQVDGQLITSDLADEVGYGGLVDIAYKPKQGTEHKLSLDYFDDSLDVSDLGFIRRNDVTSAVYSYSWSTGRGLKYLRNKRRSILINSAWNTDGFLVRSGIFFRNAWTFKNLSEIRTEVDYFPARWHDRNSFGNGRYKVDDRIVAEVGFGTNTSKKLSFSALLGVRQEELSSWTRRASVGLTYQPSDRFSVDFDLNYLLREDWLLHDRDRLFTTYDAGDFQPRVGMDLFLTSKQQIRFTMQWAGIRAKERDFYQVPLSEGNLVAIDDPIQSGLVTATNGDFAISRLTTQLRYRWEIGPLSDLFVVYTRGSNLPNRVDDVFADLFDDALSTPIVDVYVVKLRYRFGN